MPTILIADDEPHVVDLVRATLEDDRLTVHDARDGVTALSIAEALRPDVIFLDVDMPRLSGLDVCRQLRADPRLAGTTIVMLTAAAQRDDIERGLAAGADHYLTKPFSPLRLLTLVERVMPRAVVWSSGR